MQFETHRRALESSALQRLSKFLRAFEQIIRRARRQLDVQVRVRLDGIVHEFHERIFIGARPGGEAEFPARLQDATGLGTGALGSGQMKQREICQHPIEAFVREGKLLCIAFPKLEARKHSRCDADHFRREIDADRDGASFRCGRGNVPRPATDIQDR